MRHSPCRKVAVVADLLVAVEVVAVFSRILLCITTSFILITPPVYGQSISSKVGTYSDNNGLDRTRYSGSLSLNQSYDGAISASSFSYSWSKDFYDEQAVRDENNSAAPEKRTSSYHELISESISASLTVDKVNEIRIMGNVSQDPDYDVFSRTGGAGIGRWFFHDSLRLSYDFSRTLVAQPAKEFPDFDSELITLPPLVTTNGHVVAVRHLATTTTIMDYTLGLQKPSNRPEGYTAGVSIRQFIPPLEGAIHAGIAYGVDRGKATTESADGEIDARQADIAYLQEMWTGARSKVMYRYYEEHETSRAFADETVFGADFFSLSFSQDITDDLVDSMGDASMAVDLSASQYITNKDNNSADLEDEKKIRADIYELGLSANF